MDTTPPPRLDELIVYVRNRQPDGTPLDHLSDAVLASEHLGEVADHLIGHFVDQARRAGASWTEIGQSMGVTKQAAQKRFVPTGPDRGGRPKRGIMTRLTDGAQSVILRAAKLAQEHGHDTVDTEHLLLALTYEPESLAAHAIEEQGVALATVRQAAQAALGPAREPLSGHIPFGRRAKKLRELAVREALRFGHPYIGPEHILLAMLRDHRTLGAQVLDELGITRDRTEQWVLAAINDRTT
jgi:Clp amino terminal domain, pathogenicity island component